MNDAANTIIGIALSFMSGCVTLTQDRLSIENPIKQQVNYNQAEDIGYRTAAEFFTQRNATEYYRDVGVACYKTLEFVVKEDTYIPKNIEEYVIRLLRERVSDNKKYADATILVRTSARRLKTRTNWESLSASDRLVCLKAFNNGIKIAISHHF